MTEVDRAAAEAAVAAGLERLGAEARVMDVDPALADTADFCAAYGVPLERSANTILVAAARGPERHAACVLLATTRLDVNHAVKQAMGVSKASFADADTTRRVTGMEIGGVTPVALPDDLEVLIDSRVMGLGWVIVGGGGRRTKLRIDPAVLSRLPRVRICEGLAIEV